MEIKGEVKEIKTIKFYIPIYRPKGSDSWYVAGGTVYKDEPSAMAYIPSGTEEFNLITFEREIK